MIKLTRKEHQNDFRDSESKAPMKAPPIPADIKQARLQGRNVARDVSSSSTTVSINPLRLRYPSTDHSTVTLPSGIRATDPSSSNVSVDPSRAPIISTGETHVTLPAISRERIVQTSQPKVIERPVEIPHIQYLERIEKVEVPTEVTRWVPTPKVSLLEREIHIPKPTVKEKVIEVPDIELVNKTVEVPHYQYKENLIEVPKIIIQERIVPVPKRIIEEQIVELSEDEFERMLQSSRGFSSRGFSSPPPGPVRIPEAYTNEHAVRDWRENQYTGQEEFEEEEFEDEDPLLDDYYPMDDQRPLPSYGQGERRYPIHPEEPIETSGPPPSTYDYQMPPSPYSWPDTQREFHGGAQIYSSPFYRPPPLYRNIERPVRVEIPHYRPIPIQRFVDNQVPVPVELQLEEEILYPKIIPKYKRVPIKVPYHGPDADLVMQHWTGFPPSSSPYFGPLPVINRGFRATTAGARRRRPRKKCCWD